MQWGLLSGSQKGKGSFASHFCRAQKELARIMKKTNLVQVSTKNGIPEI